MMDNNDTTDENNEVSDDEPSSASDIPATFSAIGDELLWNKSSTSATADNFIKQSEITYVYNV